MGINPQMLQQMALMSQMSQMYPALASWLPMFGMGGLGGATGMGQGNPYANPFMSFMSPGAIPGAQTQSIGVPQAGPGAGNVPPMPPQSSLTTTPQASTPGAAPQAQAPVTGLDTGAGLPGVGAIGATLPPLPQTTAIPGAPPGTTAPSQPSGPPSTMPIPQGAPPGTFSVGPGWFNNGFQNPMTDQQLAAYIQGTGSVPGPGMFTR